MLSPHGTRQRLARMSQMLALLAALFLAFGPHALHAQMDDGPGHSHSGSYCHEQGANGAGEGPDSAPSAAGDCVPHFHPMTQASVDHGTERISSAVASRYAEPARQMNPSADPPPPRRTS